jgi:hypothetical protein
MWNESSVPCHIAILKQFTWSHTDSANRGPESVTGEEMGNSRLLMKRRAGLGVSG